MQSVCGRVHLAVKETVITTTISAFVTPLERVICYDCWLELVVVDWLPVLLHQGENTLLVIFILNFSIFKQLHALFGVLSHELAAFVDGMDVNEFLGPEG